jgi:DNA-binding NtrC family response regulator
MSGLELLRQVKERDPDIQLILMSGFSSVKDAVEAIQLGAADYVEKPIDFRRLARVLQASFEKRQLSTDAHPRAAAPGLHHVRGHRRALAADARRVRVHRAPRALPHDRRSSPARAGRARSSSPARCTTCRR